MRWLAYEASFCSAIFTPSIVPSRNMSGFQTSLTCSDLTIPEHLNARSSVKLLSTNRMSTHASTILCKIRVLFGILHVHNPSETLLYVNDVTQFGLVHFLQVFDNEPRSYVHGLRGQGNAAIIMGNVEPAAALIAAGLCGHGTGGCYPKQQEHR